MFMLLQSQQLDEHPKLQFDDPLGGRKITFQRMTFAQA